MNKFIVVVFTISLFLLKESCVYAAPTGLDIPTGFTATTTISVINSVSPTGAPTPFTEDFLTSTPSQFITPKATKSGTVTITQTPFQEISTESGTITKVSDEENPLKNYTTATPTPVMRIKRSSILSDQTFLITVLAFSLIGFIAGIIISYKRLISD